MLVDFVQNFGNQILLKANLSDSITYFPFALVKCDFEKYREAFSLIAFHEKLGSRNTDRTAKYTNVNEITAIPPESHGHSQYYRSPQCHATRDATHDASALGGILR